jgi:hypothetical protein
MRGLSMIGNTAAVACPNPTTSASRSAVDTELQKRDVEPWCGVQIVSPTNGDVQHWLRFDGDITEIFDLCFLPNARNPMMV